MYSEAQQPFITHYGYQFVKVIHYRDNLNFTKQHNSTPNMGWLPLWGAKGFSHSEQENNLKTPETRNLLVLQNELFHNI